MSSWAQRIHRRAATFGSVVTSCGHPGTPYPNRLEKVKFGVPLEEVCKNDIPGPLLVLILRLNKEAPCRKDVFRAPGNQGAMKKLIHFLQQGRLVNVDNYSVYTIASVLKKFLRKIPGGVFGREGEAELFQIVDLEDEAQQQEKIHRLLMSLPGHTQRLLVLLFGTFRVIASNSERAETGMTSEALGVSVAPSFFQSCVSDGKTARMKDVLRFKVATKIMKQMIEQFTACDLFGRVNYEYYARVTGRVLRVQDEWIFSFRYPPPPRGKTAQQHYALKLALETEKTWLQCECERWGLIAQEESHSTPALLTTGGPNVGPGIFNVQKSSCSSSSHSSSSNTRSGSQHHMTLDELRAVNRYAESTKSLSYLPQVHERQAARMRTRSEWFLGARGSSLELCHDGTGSLIHPQIVTSTPIPGAIGHSHHHPHGIIGTYDSIENDLNDVIVEQHHSYTANKEIEEYISDEDNNYDPSIGEVDDDDDVEGLLTHDEIDGDENDFAISQSHHFDMRAENRRRRRRALIRRNSYDRLVASGSSRHQTSATTRRTGGKSNDKFDLIGVAGPSSAVPAAAPSTGEKENKTVSKLPHPSQAEKTQIQTNHNPTDIASTSRSSRSSMPTTSFRRSMATSTNSKDSTLVNRKNIANRRNSSASHSMSIGNGNSTTLSRQSNLSMIVFSVLDFLF
uniref:Rho-GAP domain-containing protein n=1 Tax=Anopheles farauti TaxID=69004 RepID=A0A182QH72_9DIPT